MISAKTKGMKQSQSDKPRAQRIMRLPKELDEKLVLLSQKLDQSVNKLLEEAVLMLLQKKK